MTTLSAAAAGVPSTPAQASRLRQRIASARSPLPGLLLGAVAWGLLMAAAALLGLYLRFRLQTAHLQELMLLYFAGGLLAWLVAVPVGRFFAFRRSPETRFAAFFLTLTCATILATTFLFAMQYRLFYSQWHQPFGTRIWVLQFLFTSASATYQFLVLGIRLYLPLGLVFLIGASVFLARRMR